MREERLFTLKEISVATGLNKQTINSRRIKAGIPSNNSGYTYEQAKILAKRPPIKRALKKENVSYLKRKLIDDGLL